MNTARYFLAVLLLVTLPPAILQWVVIHPCAKLWRRFGVIGTYLILSPFTATLMWVLFRGRVRLLGPDLGTSWPLAAAGAACVVLGIRITLKLRRYLTFAILTGAPELSPDSRAGRLLSEGPYARIRHPRYVAVAVATFGYALVANYLGTYVLWAASLLLLYLVVVLEERELTVRFGAAYEEYRRRVPRFVPRRTGR